MTSASPLTGACTAENSADDSQSLSISVVVPVRDEARFIRRTLTQLLAQSYDPKRFEVIVVDGQSTDDTATIVREFVDRRANVQLLANPKRLSSAGRNIGIRHARGDVVLIVDGHCELDDRLLSRLATAFITSGADCVGRPQPLDVSGAGTLGRAIAAARCSRLGHHPDSHIYSSREQFVPASSVAVAYRRSVFEACGYFDEDFDACEDVEFNHRVDRAGLRCYFTPAAAVRYCPRGSLGGLFRQLARYGRGRVRLLRKHPNTFSILSLLPGVFVLGCVLGLGLTWLSHWLAAAYLVSLATYAAVLLGTSLGIGIRRRDVRILPWLPAVFAVIHVGSGCGILGELIGGRSFVRASNSPQAHGSQPVGVTEDKQREVVLIQNTGRQ